jgi:maleylpyruvate isomerase
MADLTEEAARLRERQGAGARYDADAAPARELLWARRGTAYFARKLNELSDDDLDGATLIPDWSRRRLIAHVGYQARALSQIVEAARTGEPYQAISEADRIAQLDLGETLPARALRNLFFHSEVHLNVEWRDLKDADWDAVVVDTSGARHEVRETPIIRAQAVWSHAVDLDNGGSFHDVPADLLDALGGPQTAGSD